VCKAFPYSDYYGDSVAIGLASRRRSRVPFSTGRIERDLSAPFISLNEVVLHRPSGEGYKSPNVLDLLLTASQFRRCSDERRVSPLEIRIQAIQLSPYHAGLAGQRRKRLRVSPAFLTCFCPLDFRHQVSQMTQEYSFELLLTVSMIQCRVPRRTLRLASAE
jgi:hypothetical protein